MGFWFGRKSAPERQPLVPAWLAGEAGSDGYARGYEAQLDEVYRRNPVGLRAVRLVAGLVGALPLFAEEGDGGAVPLVKAGGLMERAAAGLLLHGNAYVRLVADGHDKPAELHCMRPERVSVVTGADGWPAAYLYRAGGQVVRIAKADPLGRRQVAHLKALDPADDHYEPDRDYQTGQMRASSGHGGVRDERVELPAVLAGGEAKALAEQALARRWSAGDRIRVQLPPARMALRPGDAIQLPGASKAWIARSVSIEGLAVALEAEAAPGGVVPLLADPGRSVSDPDELVGRSELALFELPPLGDAPAPVPIAYVAASNEGAWKRLPVELSLAQAPLAAVAIGRRSVLGRAETVLAGRCPPVADELSTVTVRLTNAGQALLNADEDSLMAGANLAMLGDELIQFGRAEYLAAGLYRLSRLLRGRRGTEWAANGHVAGEPFCLINRADLRPVELPSGAVGAVLMATAYGVGDVAPLPSRQRTISGETLKPPSPCHVRLWRDGSTVRAEWVRRSHHAWAWVDGIGDAEEGFAELYRLAMIGPAGMIELETSSRSASWALADLPAQPGQTLNLSISTVGQQAVSRTAFATLIL